MALTTVRAYQLTYSLRHLMTCPDAELVRLVVAIDHADARAKLAPGCGCPPLRVRELPAGGDGRDRAAR